MHEITHLAANNEPAEKKLFSRPLIHESSADMVDQSILMGSIENEIRYSRRCDDLITQVEKALERIENGEFGYCELTGEPIDLRRLEVQPWATLSIKTTKPNEDAMKIAELTKTFGKITAVDTVSFSIDQPQMVAIARALMQTPKMVLADEPIASLDPLSAEKVMNSLREIRDRDNLTVICNLHTLDTARTYCDRVIGMLQGRIVFDDVPEKLAPSVVRDIYGANEELNESVTSTAIFKPGKTQASGQPTPALTPLAANG